MNRPIFIIRGKRKSDGAAASAMIDGYDSAVWDRQFYDVGAAEIVCTNKVLCEKILQFTLPCWLQRTDSDEIYFVNEIKTKSDNGNLTVTVSAADCKYFFQFIDTQFIFDYTAEQASPTDDVETFYRKAHEIAIHMLEGYFSSSQSFIKDTPLCAITQFVNSKKFEILQPLYPYKNTPTPSIFSFDPYYPFDNKGKSSPSMFVDRDFVLFKFKRESLDKILTTCAKQGRFGIMFYFSKYYQKVEVVLHSSFDVNEKNRPLKVFNSALHNIVSYLLTKRAMETSSIIITNFSAEKDVDIMESAADARAPVIMCNPQWITLQSGETVDMAFEKRVDFPQDEDATKQFDYFNRIFFYQEKFDIPKTDDEYIAQKQMLESRAFQELISKKRKKTIELSDVKVSIDNRDDIDLGELCKFEIENGEFFFRCVGIIENYSGQESSIVAEFEDDENNLQCYDAIQLILKSSKIAPGTFVSVANDVKFVKFSLDGFSLEKSENTQTVIDGKIPFRKNDEKFFYKSDLITLCAARFGIYGMSPTKKLFLIPDRFSKPSGTDVHHNVFPNYAIKNINWGDAPLHKVAYWVEKPASHPFDADQIFDVADEIPCSVYVLDPAAHNTIIADEYLTDWNLGIVPITTRLPDRMYISAVGDGQEKYVSESKIFEIHPARAAQNGSVSVIVKRRNKSDVYFSTFIVDHEAHIEVSWVQTVDYEIILQSKYGNLVVTYTANNGDVVNEINCISFENLVPLASEGLELKCILTPFLDTQIFSDYVTFFIQYS